MGLFKFPLKGPVLVPGSIEDVDFKETSDKVQTLIINDPLPVWTPFWTLSERENILKSNLIVGKGKGREARFPFKYVHVGMSLIYNQGKIVNSDL